jgi:hypothetical protein
MIRMHVPKQAVAMKMQSEGLDPSILDMDPTGPAPAGGMSAPPPPPPPGGPPPPPPPRF